MKDYIFEAEMWLPYPVDTVFSFFQEAKNLEAITPDFLQFRILNVSTENIEQDTLIDYRLKLYGIPFKWRTKITDWQPPHQFTDSQLKGPYQKWVHTHRFQEKDGGALMTDRVIYRISGGVFAPFVNKFFVRNNVENIFTYREAKIREIFPDLETSDNSLHADLFLTE